MPLLATYLALNGSVGAETSSSPAVSSATSSASIVAEASTVVVAWPSLCGKVDTWQGSIMGRRRISVKPGFKAEKKSSYIVGSEGLRSGGDGHNHWIIFTSQSCQDMQDLVFFLELVTG